MIGGTRNDRIVVPIVQHHDELARRLPKINLRAGPTIFAKRRDNLDDLCSCHPCQNKRIVIDPSLDNRAVIAQCEQRAARERALAAREDEDPFFEAPT